MRKLLLLAAFGGAMALGACASGGYYGAGYGYNYSGPSDVWYDGYYGPYTDGYWGVGDAFYFRGMDGRYYGDRDGHFRTQAFGDAQHFNARHR